MAAPVVNGSVYIAGSNVTTSSSVNVTVNSGLTNSVLVAVVGAVRNSVVTTDVSSVTFGGVSLTKRAFVAVPATTLYAYFIWTLDNPTAGTSSGVTTQTAMQSNTFFFVITGALQGGALDQAISAAEIVTSTSASVDITPNFSNTLIFDLFFTSGNPSSPVFGGTQTSWINSSPSPVVGDGAFSSYQSQGTAALQNMSVSWTGNNSGIYGAFNFQSSGGGTSTALPYRTLLGVGI